ncbi:hypothetical protein [Peristeroidobacter soli]|uniref:hypothetical protein n=1 Tax=Peristeroidobacter soli TaxID=2497877 RepID=UPI00101D8C0E|nr:hypothetical protein [Peristeroidobacter soli]
MFSDSLHPNKKQPDTGIPKDFAGVEHDILSVQRRYIGSVASLSQLSAGTSAALIGISAFGLFKGLTDGSSKDIAAAGVLGTATWAVGTTFTSKPRQRIYLAGAAALGCAVSTAKPYDKTTAWQDELNRDLKASALASEELRNWQEKYAPLTVTVTLEAIQAAVPQTEECKKPVECPELNGTTFRVEGAKVCELLRADREKKCAPRGGRKQSTVPPSPELMSAYERAGLERTRVKAALETARETANSVREAATNLWNRSVQIQTQVSSEVLSTEPDADTVLNTVKGLSDRIIPPPDVWKAQSGYKSSKMGPSPKEQQAIAELEPLLIRSFQARVNVESKVAQTQPSRDNQGIAACRFVPPSTQQNAAAGTQTPATAGTDQSLAQDTIPN